MRKKKTHLSGFKFNWLFLILLFLLTILLRLPTINRPFDLAYESFIAFWGREVFTGGGFYSTPWTFKPPGEALVYGLIYRLVGFENWVLGVRVFSSFMAGAATIFIYLLGKKLFGGWSGIMAALIFAVFSQNIKIFGGDLAQAEMWMPATTVLGYYLFFVAQERRSYLIRFLAGLSLGASLSFKQSALYDFIPLAIYSFGSGILNLKREKNNLKTHFLSQLPLLLGFVLPMGIFVLYISLIGKFSLLWDWMVIKTSIYSAIRESHPLTYIRSILQKIYPIVILGLLGVAATILRRDRKRVLFILWLLFTPLVFISSGKFWDYYFLQFFVPMAILAGIFIGDLLSLRKKLVTILVITSVFYLLLNFSMVYYQRTFYNFLAFLEGQISKENYVLSLSEGNLWKVRFEAAEFLKHNSQPGGISLIMDGSPGIYILSDKEPAYQEFLYKQQFFENKAIGFAFMHSFETYEKNRCKLLESLENSPPNFIVLTVDSPADAFTEMKAFPRFFSFVFSNYDLVKDNQDSWVYKLKDRKVKPPKELVIDYQFAKKYTLISPLSKDKVIIESLGGDPDGLEAILTNASDINFSFSTIEIKFLRFDGKDFTGHGSEKPSGTIDLHLGIVKEDKLIKMIKIKKKISLWVFPSNGINSTIKVFNKDRNLDLYFEPPGSWEKEVFEVSIIYQDGSLARGEIKVE